MRLVFDKTVELELIAIDVVVDVSTTEIVVDVGDAVGNNKRLDVIGIVQFLPMVQLPVQIGGTSSTPHPENFDKKKTPKTIKKTVTSPLSNNSQNNLSPTSM